MPINVDTVYQTVQALANKEQRGYLTPQEFNLFANQVQVDIFEQYFYDLNAFGLERPMQRTIGDSVNHIMHKLNNTDGVVVAQTACTYTTVGTFWTLPAAVLTGRIFSTNSNIRQPLRVMEMDKISDLLSSKWHQAAFTENVYFEDGYNRIQVWNGAGAIGTGVTCETVTGAPDMVFWNYLVINEKPVYDMTSSANFSLHASEQSDVVMKVLKLAGVSIEDSGLYQSSSQEDQQNQQQENK